VKEEVKPAEDENEAYEVQSAVSDKKISHRFFHFQKFHALLRFFSFQLAFVIAGLCRKNFDEELADELAA